MSADFLRKLPIILTIGLICWFGAKFLLPIAVPFLLAAALAAAAEPLVSVTEKRLHFPRPAATALGVTVTMGLLGLLVAALGGILLRQLQRLVGVMPDLEGTAAEGIQSLKGWLLSLANGAPEGIRGMLSRSLQNFFSDGTAMLDQLTTRLLALAGGIVSHLPDSALGLGTWLVASFMFSAKLPKIRAWMSRHMAKPWQERYFPMLRRLKESVFGWLWAQLKLMSVTFLVLCLGFWLLRVEHGIILALLISFVDALPILGTGTVLIPWSLVSFIQGDTAGGLGLLGIYLTGLLLRSILEPKLVGRQLGLDPLVTLMAMYAGYRLWGILGLLLSPLLAVTVLQIFSLQNQQ